MWMFLIEKPEFKNNLFGREILKRVKKKLLLKENVQFVTIILILQSNFFIGSEVAWSILICYEAFAIIILIISVRMFQIGNIELKKKITWTWDFEKRKKINLLLKENVQFVTKIQILQSNVFIGSDVACSILMYQVFAIMILIIFVRMFQMVNIEFKSNLICNHGRVKKMF